MSMPVLVSVPMAPHGTAPHGTAPHGDGAVRRDSTRPGGARMAVEGR